MWNQKIKQTSKYNKKETDSENKLVVTSGEREGGRGKIGEEDQEVQTTMYKINKLQGYTVQHRKHSQYFIITLNGV